MAEIVVREGETARTVTVATGDEVKVELSENPTTGFRWQVTSVDAGVLRLQSDDFVPSAGAAVGSSGLRVFRFAAVNSGGTEVRLELKRPWEAQPPRSTFAILVSVG